MYVIEDAYLVPEQPSTASWKLFIMYYIIIHDAIFYKYTFSRLILQNDVKSHMERNWYVNDLQQNYLCMEKELEVRSL